jgi:hypothetical protein
MNISKINYDIILNEFSDVIGLIDSTENLEDKLYYFTASYGVINRVMNLETDPTLIFIHQVLQNCFQAISQRLAARTKLNVSSDVPQEMIEQLFSLFKELKIAFEIKDKIRIWEILQRFSNLSYAMSGNGYYMYLREKINFEVDKTVINKN